MDRYVVRKATIGTALPDPRQVPSCQQTAENTLNVPAVIVESLVAKNREKHWGYIHGVQNSLKNGFPVAFW